MSETSKLEFVALYRLEDGKGGAFLKVCTLKEDGTPDLDNYSMFKSVGAFNYSGWVCSATGSLSEQDGSINRLNTKAIRPVRVLKDLREECQLRDLTEMKVREMIRTAKKEDAVALIEETLEPIINRMRRTNPQGRAALAALVMQTLLKA
ncbi:hypothetical protein NVP1215B_033 [Vibrio phage 1.215.B._10N.222.54.F7]|nr:hypothetical protein NVP1215A_033 [Vibrio phage 1.215.A._10N.222.54.F7]AUR96056.1 hypothetical protein NVP1215B_033 [Vibrio phage 1.215.B._10N.222.54.F7]